MTTASVRKSTQRARLAGYKKTWDLSFAYHHPRQAFDAKELHMCVGDPVATRRLIGGNVRSVNS